RDLGRRLRLLARRQGGTLQPDDLVEVVQLVVGRPWDQLLALGLALALLGPQLVVHLGEPGEGVVHPAPLLGLRADRLHLGGEADRVHVVGGRAARRGRRRGVGGRLRGGGFGRPGRWWRAHPVRGRRHGRLAGQLGRDDRDRARRRGLGRGALTALR